jgi:hypothetical protein
MDKAKQYLFNPREDDFYTFKPGNKIIILKKGSIKKISNPIPWTSSDSVIRSLRYSTIQKLKEARTTDDL